MKRHRSIYYSIFLLTLLDVFFTAIGLQMGFIKEANPIMNYFMNLSVCLTMLAIMLFVGLVLIFLYRQSFRVHWVNKALTGVAGVKLYIILLHIRWIGTVLNKTL